MYFLTIFVIIFHTGDFMELSNFTINDFSTIKDKVFSTDEIKQYVNSIVSFLEITDYLTSISFVNNRYQDLAVYNFKYMTLKISLIAITNEVKMEINYNDKIDFTLFTNLLIISTLIHEINHIVQNHLVTESNIPIANIFRRELEIFTAENDYIVKYYQTNYSSFIFEREANINSIENILKIIIKYCYDSEIYSYYFELLKEELISGYEKHLTTIYSPIERIYDELLCDKVPIVNNISLYDRIKLGFQVSKEEYEEFNENIDSIILSKNNLPNI